MFCQGQNIDAHLKVMTFEQQNGGVNHLHSMRIAFEEEGLGACHAGISFSSPGGLHFHSLHTLEARDYEWVMALTSSIATALAVAWGFTFFYSNTPKIPFHAVMSYTGEFMEEKMRDQHKGMEELQRMKHELAALLVTVSKANAAADRPGRSRLHAHESCRP